MTPPLTGAGDPDDCDDEDPPLAQFTIVVRHVQATDPSWRSHSSFEKDVHWPCLFTRVPNSIHERVDESEASLTRVLHVISSSHACALTRRSTLGGTTPFLPRHPSPGPWKRMFSMETMSAQPIAVSPQMSQIRHPVSRAADPATRFGGLHVPDSSATTSQDSMSSGSLSQRTNYTDITSPTSSAPNETIEPTSRPRAEGAGRASTPDESNRSLRVDRDVPFASPEHSAPHPATNGAKRTASGHVKNAPSLPATPVTAEFGRRRPRADSISSAGSRAGELAANLKTRLGYAMAKVQHGWEHRTIAEVEQLAAHKLSPNRHSMSQLEFGQRPMTSGLSNGTARLSMYDHYRSAGFDGASSPPSKRHSGTYSSFMASQQHPIAALGAVPQLQPAADIQPTGPRHFHTRAHSSQAGAYSSAMSPPRTPLHTLRRPPTLRTDIQTAEAERDALQALFQLGSPHAAQFSRYANATASQASSNQASPLRTEFATPRKVTFARSDSESSARPSSSGSSAVSQQERQHRTILGVPGQ